MRHFRGQLLSTQKVQRFRKARASSKITKRWYLIMIQDSQANEDKLSGREKLRRYQAAVPSGGTKRLEHASAF
jgi:hypothetical protein